ncbi:MAG TPA: hypothetical protein VNH41_06115 [Steroidobacteraceae bacterium]|nr:hypothetical protein [Steroidobacteraceae bacterium]
MASPEAASVVEQLKVLANSGTHTLIDNMDLRALLALVEAAIEAHELGKRWGVDLEGPEVLEMVLGVGPEVLEMVLGVLEAPVFALYTPDSAEERES